MFVSSDPAWLQGAFRALVAIFTRVGLQTNVGKTVSMACHPCWAGDGNRTEAAYIRRLTGLGKTYTERQRERVACGECGTVIAVGSMSSHLMTRHGKSATRRHLWSPQTNGGPRTYKMHFPAKGGRRRCPVERCTGVLATRAAMRVHFVHQHVHNAMVILEEGNLSLPRCPRCDLQVSRKALNRRQLGTSQCGTGTERKRRQLAEAEMRVTSEKAFHAYGVQMRAVTEFKYLGRVLTNTDNDWPAVASNIQKARANWDGWRGYWDGRERKRRFHAVLYCRDTADPPFQGGVVVTYQKDGI